MRYFSSSEATQLCPTFERVFEIVENCIASIGTDNVLLPPRSTMDSRQGSRFIAFPALLEQQKIAGVKWFGLSHSGVGGSAKREGALIILSRTDDPLPFAILDAQRITAIRTAAVSAVAAKVLAQPDSSVVSFIACGEQGRLHLEALRKIFPLRHVKAFSRRPETAEAFAEHARTFGVEAKAYTSLEECISNAHIVISSSPAVTEQLVSISSLQAHSFFSLVDLGRSLDLSTFPAGHRVVVDDVKQAVELTKNRKISLRDTTQFVSLAELLKAPSWSSDSPRVFLPTGVGAIDLQIAYEIYLAGMDSEYGLTLPR